MPPISKTIIILLLIAFIFPHFNISSVKANDTNKTDTFYGFIIDVNSSQPYDVQNNISRLVNKLIQDDLPVYWLSSDETFKIQGINEEEITSSKMYQKGSIVVKFSSDSSINKKVASFSYMYSLNGQVEAHKIMEKVDNVKAYKLVKPRIAYLDVSNSNYTTMTPYYMRQGGFSEVDMLDWDEIPQKLNNKDYNLFICGGATTDTLKSAGVTVFEINRAVNTISRFIKNGGGYVGTCFGSYLASSGIVLPINFLHASFPNLPLLNIGFIGCDYATMNALPGGGDVKVRAVVPDHPIFFGVNETTNHYLAEGGAIFNWHGRHTEILAVLDDINEDRFDWWDGNDEEDKYNIPKSLRNIWTNFGLNKPIVAVSTLGEGRAINFGTHPEFGVSWEKQYRDWTDSRRLIYNSIFFSIVGDPIDIGIDYSDSFDLLNVDAGGPYYGLEGDEIKFKGSVTNGAYPYNWYWEFEVPYWYYYRSDDDYISDEQNPSVNYYSIDGDSFLKVNLLVTDSYGNFGFDYANVKILNYYEELSIDVDSQSFAYAGDKIQFFSYVSDGLLPYEHHWAFGDGGESFKENPVHIFNDSGVYEVALKVSDQFGVQKSVNTTITVKLHPERNIGPEEGPYSLLLVIVSLIFLVCLFFIVIKYIGK